MGQERVPRHVQTTGDGQAKGKAKCKKRTGPRTAKSICKILNSTPSRARYPAHALRCAARAERRGTGRRSRYLRLQSS